MKERRKVIRLYDYIISGDGIVYGGVIEAISELGEEALKYLDYTVAE